MSESDDVGVVEQGGRCPGASTNRLPRDLRETSDDGSTYLDDRPSAPTSSSSLRKDALEKLYLACQNHCEVVVEKRR